MCSMSFNVDHSKHSRKKKKTTETKETYAQSLTTFYVYFPPCFIYNTPFVVLAPSSVSRCALYVPFVNPKPHPSSIPTPSVWVCHLHPPAPSRFLAVPKLELEARHPPRNGDLCSHRDDLKQAFLHQPFPSHRPTIPPRNDTSCQLVDELTALYPETPKAFHC